jgi:hypothetical protein
MWSSQVEEPASSFRKGRVFVDVRAAGAKQNRKDDSIQTPARKQTMQADVHEFAFTTVPSPFPYTRLMVWVVA